MRWTGRAPAVEIRWTEPDPAWTEAALPHRGSGSSALTSPAPLAAVPGSLSRKAPVAGTDSLGNRLCHEVSEDPPLPRPFAPLASLAGAPG